MIQKYSKKYSTEQNTYSFNSVKFRKYTCHHSSFIKLHLPVKSAFVVNGVKYIVNFAEYSCN